MPMLAGKRSGMRRPCRDRGPWPMGLTVLLVSALLSVPLFPGPARAETIRLGAILPLTGPAARIGSGQMRALRNAVEEANALGDVRGHRIEIVFEDSAAKPAQAIAAFRTLMRTPRVEVIFVSYSGPALALAPLAARGRVLLVNAGAQADRLAVASPYLINTIPGVGEEMAALSRHVRARGQTRAAILYENTAAGLSGRDAFAEAFAKAGGIIVAQEEHLFGEGDFTPALMKLAASGPEVVVVSITAGLPGLATEYRRLGLTFTVAGTGFFQDPALRDSGAAEGFVWARSRGDAFSVMSGGAMPSGAGSGPSMDVASPRYREAAHIVLSALRRSLMEGHPITGQTTRDMIFRMRAERGPPPLTVRNNMVSASIDIVTIRDGVEIILESGRSE